MTTTRSTYVRRLLAPLVATPLLLAGAACGVLPGGGSGGSGGGERASGVNPDWYDAVDEQAAKAKKDGHFGGTPYLDTDQDCALTDEVRLGKDGEDGTDDPFASGASDPGDGGKQYVCEFHDPAVDLVVARFPRASSLDEVEEDVSAQENPQNDQTDHTYTVRGWRIIVKRTTYPTNDSHIDYTATWLDRRHHGVVMLQVETTDEMRSTYSSRQAAKDLAGLLSRS